MMEFSGSAAQRDLSRSLRRLTLTGTAAILCFAGTFGVWSATATLGGAVVGAGQFVVDGSVKKVQHSTGGIVGELPVREGDRVERGQLLVRLDDTLTRANLQVLAKQLDELSIRRMRLKAEYAADGRMDVPPDLASRMQNPEIAELIASEQALFAARRAVREGQKAQLMSRIGQLKEEVGGLASQQEAVDQQTDLIALELTSVRGLYEKSLVSLSRKGGLEREAANMAGRRGQIVATIAETRSKIAETELAVLQVDDAIREDAMKQLREIQAQIAELSERHVAALDQLKRVEIRAPTSGFVHQLAVHAAGEVVSSAEPLMLIVPTGEALQAEVKINPVDIDQVSMNQPARVRIRAFNQRMTPELEGTVTRISADAIHDAQSGASFYTIRVAIPPEQYARIAPNTVTAGMQTDVFIRTEDRSPLQFLLKPLADQAARVFIER